MVCNETDSVVGGDWYYIEQEGRIQKSGDGDTMRVVNSSWEIYQGNAPKLCQVSRDRQNTVLQALGREVGVGNDVLISSLNYASSASGSVSFAYTEWLPGGGTSITINNNTDLFKGCL